MNLADNAVHKIRHIQTGAVTGDADCPVERGRSTGAVRKPWRTPRIGRAREAAHRRRRYHDLADFVVAKVHHIQVAAVGGDAVRGVKRSRRK